ncbi:hypothetical protein [Acaryochloris marina]|uniref:Uncharacterized protein n=1 Tax=Acaryochloris marina (strain MBIC 11017) TaxID=329726 RepID=A8ZM62_ACAM1|nr:hypothetical protein [Acaryochloris marina]ABW31831.1 hypothetical protein AM1_B0105 [Acaryochloris marina MBIC11017]
MKPPIISLNPKPIPQTTPGQPKPAPSAQKLLSKTAFPKKAPEGTWPPKREPRHEELGGIRHSSRRTSRTTRPKKVPQSASSENLQVSQPRTPRESAELERLFRNLELSQKDFVEQVKKGGDVVVGHRQKNKGMSWSERGSRALGILKTVELNGQWEQLWFPQTIAE